MIIEIALGIILAIAVLYILARAMPLLGFFVLLVFLAIVVDWLKKHPEIGYMIGAIVIGVVSHLVWKRIKERA